MNAAKFTATSVSKVLSKKFDRAVFIRSGRVDRNGFSARKYGEYTVVVDCNRVDRNYSEEIVVPQLNEYAMELTALGFSVDIRKEFNQTRLFIVLAVR